jgi:hypothetical protein
MFYNPDHRWRRWKRKKAKKKQNAKFWNFGIGSPLASVEMDFKRKKQKKQFLR